jgi:hypothetical protein
MSLLGRLFGGEKEHHPPLDPASAEGARMERHREVATAFAQRIHDKLEVVPGERVLYAFIGNPPDAFGIAWFEGGEEHNLKTLMKAKGLSQLQVQHISEELRHAYVRSQGEPRYVLEAGKKKITVTPSASLERELVKIIHEAAD